MTLAICIRCGAEKPGAFVQCASCGLLPMSDEDMAKSVMISDHYYTRDDLLEIGASVAGGHILQFRPEDVAPMVQAIRENGTRRMLGLPPEPAEKKAKPWWKFFSSGR